LPRNWREDGFGSQSFNDIFGTTLSTTVDKGLMFDISTLGEVRAKASPAEYQFSGLLKE
jgi:hypothetical protein